MYLFHGVLDYWGGEGEKSQNNFEKARALLPDHRKFIGGFIEITLSWARYMTGQKELALNELTKLQVEGKGSGLYHSRLVGGFLYIHLFSGDLMLFRKECQYLQDLAQRHDLRYTNAMGICLEAGSYFHEYELEEAFHHFSMAAQKRYIMHKRTAIDGLAGQVITEQLMQKTADADKSLDFLDSL